MVRYTVAKTGDVGLPYYCPVVYCIAMLHISGTQHRENEYQCDHDLMSNLWVVCGLEIESAHHQKCCFHHMD